MNPSPIFVCSLFAVKDLKADECTQFFTDRNVFCAIRGFSHMVGREGSLFGEFPDDFSLVHLASINSDGSVVPLERPVQLAVARDFLRKSPTSHPVATPGPEGE